MAFKMYGKSPMMKALVGKQVNLPANLKAKIEAAPETPMNMYGKSPMDMYGKSAMKKRGCGCKSGACMCGKRK